MPARTPATTTAASISLTRPEQLTPTGGQTRTQLSSARRIAPRAPTISRAPNERARIRGTATTTDAGISLHPTR
ncbi:hypothetical protein CH306_15590 [Rhodococcus sp. 15-725-2-2b]|nr:hypothetical protein CH264_22560 [Rhodococcus sp. 06-1477-1A]OZE72167.1 hypothetical protein CH306_15590 [Rhodococcus sp. 15-725-2-2b]